MTPDDGRLTSDNLDRLEIKNLVAKYTHGIDGRDEALFASLWAPNAVWHFVSEGGVAGKIDGIDAILETFRKATSVDRQMHHFSSNLLIELDGDRATGRSKSVTSGQAAPLFVSYDDEFIRLDGEWRFLVREVRAHLAPPPASEAAS